MDAVASVIAHLSLDHDRSAFLTSLRCLHLCMQLIGIKLKIECNQIKQYLCNVSEMAYILQAVRIRDYRGILTLQMDKGNLKKYFHSIQDTSITISVGLIKVI